MRPTPHGAAATARRKVRDCIGVRAGRERNRGDCPDVHVMGSSIHSPRCGATQSISSAFTT